MKTTASELKKRAKRSLAGKYGICVGANLIIGFFILVIAFAIVFFMTFSMMSGYDYNSEPDFSGIWLFMLLYFLVMAVVMLFVMGMEKMYLNICTGRPESLGDLLFVFSRNPLKYLGLYFLRLFLSMVLGIPYGVVMMAGLVTNQLGVMVFLQFIMYVFWLVGSVVLQIYFSQADYLLLEYPDKKVFQCVRESMAMVKGNKGRLFYLYLSFIGVFLLCYITFGIGFLWVLPYMSCTMIHFYLDLKGNQEQYIQQPYTGDPFTVPYEEIR